MEKMPNLPEKMSTQLDSRQAIGIVKDFMHIMATLETSTGENDLVKLDKPLEGMPEGSWTAKENLEIYVRLVEKCIPVLSPKDRKIAEDLLIRAKLYVAGA